MTEASSASFKQHTWKPRYRSTTCDLLQDFYLPVLRVATQYDRVAEYFRATSLAAASQGFTALMRHRARVRLVVGADLDPKDAQVILDHQDDAGLAESLLAALGDPDGLQEPAADGLALLAWMLKAGSLALRSLLLPGLARRVLIAPPASLARQWQNELVTEFFLRCGRALTGPQVRHH